MKILIIKSELPFPAQSGSCLITYNLIKVLSKCYDVSLVSLLHSEKDLVYCDHLKSLRIEVHSVIAPYDKSFLSRIMYKVLRLLKRIVRGIPREVDHETPKVFRELVRDVLSRKSYDLVQIDFWYSSELVDLVGRVPKVLFTHHIFSDLLSQTSAKSKSVFQKILLAEHAKSVARHEDKWFEKFDRIINVTARDAEILRRRFPSFQHKMETLPLIWSEIQTRTEKRKMLLGKHSLIIVGDMNHLPNVDAAIYFTNDILPQVEEQVPDVVFYIVGKNPRKEIRNLAKRRNVKVTGFVPDVLPYIRGATAYVCPMRLTDGIKIKLIDAMLCGKPVIASQVATNGYKVRNGQELLIADTPEDFAQKVVSVLTDQFLCEQLGDNAKNYVRCCHMGLNVERLILQEYERWGLNTPINISDMNRSTC